MDGWLEIPRVAYDDFSSTIEEKGPHQQSWEEREKEELGRKVQATLR
jgi:hypothetical protein